jgi:small-conductance mechanosensitive channel
VLSAAIALSSTTILGNALAGVMLRVIRNFRMGDFIRSGDHFGRVSERGLFHTEIQTEDRDLTTLPNLYLVTHPVKTIRSSGTVISASVSLGYDVPRAVVEELLLESARQAGLKDPFVQIHELGDFSVSYRIAGLLGEVKQILSARSRLRANVMDRLHEGGVEIVSPRFMNIRALGRERVFIPKPAQRAAADGATALPEEVVCMRKDRLEEILAERESGTV